MSDRASQFGSGSGVLLAMVGSMWHDTVLSLLGPAVALAFHCWGSWKAGKMEALVDHLKTRNFQLEMEIAKLRGSVPTPPQAIP